MNKFDYMCYLLMCEAQQTPELPPDDSQEEQPAEGGGNAEGGDEGGLSGPEHDLGGLDDDLGLEGDSLAPDEPVSPEEMELAKLAVRALNFNIKSKDVHQFSLQANGTLIPFEKISDYLEQTKDYKRVLAFIEFVMNKFEGVSSKWTEDPEIRGKSINSKIQQFLRELPPEQQMDNGKRVYWTRIILNALLRGGPDFNLVSTDVNEENIKEIFALLKQHFGTDTRGMMPNKQFPAPGVF